MLNLQPTRSDATAIERKAELAVVHDDALNDIISLCQQVKFLHEIHFASDHIVIRQIEKCQTMSTTFA